MRADGFTHTSRSPRSGIIVILLLLALAAPAHGHSARLQFASWGGFAPEVLRCQRTIARSAAECGHDTWAAQRVCDAARLAGQTCNQDATDAVITAIHAKALNAVEMWCSQDQLRPLEYLGRFDMENDIIKFCRDWQTTATATVYAAIDRAPGLSPGQRECVAATADVTDTMAQFTFRNRRRYMDRIAALTLQAPNRTALLDIAAKHMTQMRTTLTAHLVARCDPMTFATLYPLTPEAFVERLSTRADCLGGQLYIQDSVLCPNGVCGNGIVEPGEDCDDGNAVDGDACPSNCRFQSP